MSAGSTSTQLADSGVCIEHGSGSEGLGGFGARLDLPEELPRLDGRGYTLIPRLIDGHAHSFGPSLNDALRFGVTTVLDQFAPPTFALAKRVARGGGSRQRA